MSIMVMEIEQNSGLQKQSDVAQLEGSILPEISPIADLNPLLSASMPSVDRLLTTGAESSTAVEQGNAVTMSTPDFFTKRWGEKIDVIFNRIIDIEFLRGRNFLKAIPYSDNVYEKGITVGEGIRAFLLPLQMFANVFGSDNRRNSAYSSAQRFWKRETEQEIQNKTKPDFELKEPKPSEQTDTSAHKKGAAQSEADNHLLRSVVGELREMKEYLFRMLSQ